MSSAERLALFGRLADERIGELNKELEDAKTSGDEVWSKETDYL